MFLQNPQVVAATTLTAALLQDDTFATADNNTFERMTLLAPTVVTLVLLLAFRLAFGLLHSVDQEGQLRIGGDKIFQIVDPGASTLLLLFGRGYHSLAHDICCG